ncbi:hypothetical protein EJ05DRAFT_513986 [Pseudovirgaria hyperparasitica]|uniref:Uncharacterized protein n=1 Tax=Pseudovirgaria hyperparasitica TaxID=470096 RepID=A0A6A6VXU7_9PEZI|nr:uncharacterized protein EJ05DRAFT_513986 [Pseudovirgaria hyperparasitica]KAF2754514.1 hypothetical protein EJ05DRAFT_513986 [Pseudovirgaria hyperparasitica]
MAFFTQNYRTDEIWQVRKHATSQKPSFFATAASSILTALLCHTKYASHLHDLKAESAVAVHMESTQPRQSPIPVDTLEPERTLIRRFISPGDRCANGCPRSEYAVTYFTCPKTSWIDVETVRELAIKIVGDANLIDARPYSIVPSGIQLWCDGQLKYAERLLDEDLESEWSSEYSSNGSAEERSLQECEDRNRERAIAEDLDMENCVEEGEKEKDEIEAITGETGVHGDGKEEEEDENENESEHDPDTDDEDVEEVGGEDYDPVASYNGDNGRPDPNISHVVEPDSSEDEYLTDASDSRSDRTITPSPPLTGIMRLGMPDGVGLPDPMTDYYGLPHRPGRVPIRYRYHPAEEFPGLLNTRNDVLEFVPHLMKTYNDRTLQIVGLNVTHFKVFNRNDLVTMHTYVRQGCRDGGDGIRGMKYYIRQVRMETVYEYVRNNPDQRWKYGGAPRRDFWDASILEN